MNGLSVSCAFINSICISWHCLWDGEKKGDNTAHGEGGREQCDAGMRGGTALYHVFSGFYLIACLIIPLKPLVSLCLDGSRNKIIRNSDEVKLSKLSFLVNVV